jgi:sugar/nucleoside kinase (ribokinase family)
LVSVPVFGSDPSGDICIQRLGASGVDLSRVRGQPGKTAGLRIVLPQRQQRYILTYPGTMYDLSEKDLELRHVFDAKHLHVSSHLFCRRRYGPS